MRPTPPFCYTQTKQIQPSGWIDREDWNGITMGIDTLLASPFVWLVVAALAAVVEAVSFGLITLWFFVGALAAFVVAFLGGSLVVQLAVFLVVSIACLVLLRPVIMKNRKRGKEHEASPVGSNAVVVEAIDNDAMVGRVETPDHMTWAAISADGSPIDAGARVRVVDNKSIKLVVERM